MSGRIREDMETGAILDKYIREYYADWLLCSQRWCSMLGIPNEAYDLLADVLLSLCQKPAMKVLEMIEHEEAGDRKLFFYVRKAIRLTIYDFRARRARHFIALDFLPNLQPEQDCNETADELFDQFREVTAVTRADDFIDINNPYMGQGWISRCVVTVKSTHGRIPRVRYAVSSTTGHQHQFGCRSSAVAFLAKQNTPPRKNTIRTH